MTTRSACSRTPANASEHRGRAVVGQRLVDGPQAPPGVPLPHRGERGGHRRRVVPVVVEHDDAADVALQLQPAAHARVRAESPRAIAPGAAPAATRDAGRHEAVLRVVTSRQGEAGGQATVGVQPQDLEASLPRRVAPAGDDGRAGPTAVACVRASAAADGGRVRSVIDDAHDQQPAGPVAEALRAPRGPRCHRRWPRATGASPPPSKRRTQAVNAATTAARSAKTSGWSQSALVRPPIAGPIRDRSCRRTRPPPPRSGGRGRRGRSRGRARPRARAAAARPTNADGSRPASTSRWTTQPVVVDLPCVPATPISAGRGSRPRRRSAAGRSWRGSRRAGRGELGMVGATAVSAFVTASRSTRRVARTRDTCAGACSQARGMPASLERPGVLRWAARVAAGHASRRRGARGGLLRRPRRRPAPTTWMRSRRARGARRAGRLQAGADLRRRCDWVTPRPGPPPRRLAPSSAPASSLGASAVAAAPVSGLDVAESTSLGDAGVGPRGRRLGLGRRARPPPGELGLRARARARRSAGSSGSAAGSALGRHRGPTTSRRAASSRRSTLTQRRSTTRWRTVGRREPRAARRAGSNASSVSTRIAGRAEPLGDRRPVDRARGPWRPDRGHGGPGGRGSCRSARCRRRGRPGGRPRGRPSRARRRSSRAHRRRRARRPGGPARRATPRWRPGGRSPSPRAVGPRYVPGRRTQRPRAAQPPK